MRSYASAPPSALWLEGEQWLQRSRAARTECQLLALSGPFITEPSNLTILGRYILQPEIFDILSAKETGAGGEIQITDAMIRLLATQDFHAVKYDGRTFDCGSKLGFLLANVAYALDRGDLGAAFAAEVKKLL